MKATIQKVLKANVEVDGLTISSIGRGLCVLVGIHKDDTEEDKKYLARKLLSLRLWDDEESRRWSKSVTDMQYEILCVSQFTLYYTLKGNKPDFRSAMPSEQSEAFYQSFLNILRSMYREDKIKDGKFGAYMQVGIQNDGPVTLELESPTILHHLRQQEQAREKEKQEKHQTRKVKSEESTD